MREDFDEGIPNPYDGETDAELLEYVGSFFWQWTDLLNGVLTYDWDENDDPSVPDSAWYLLLIHGLLIRVYKQIIGLEWDR